MYQTTAFSEATLPLSSTQREIWFDQRLHPELPLYNIGGYLRIDGPLDPARFARALQRLVLRHDALRSVFLAASDDLGEPRQRFAASLPFDVPLIDFSNEPDPQHAADEWMQREFERPFRLQGEPLFRYRLLRLGEHRWHWFGCYHHLISDGWSIALLARSLADLYARGESNAAPPLPAATSYLDFIEADCRYLASDACEASRRYWAERYARPIEPLLQAQAGPAPGDRAGAFLRCRMPPDWLQGLESFAQRHGATAFHAALAALYVNFVRTHQKSEWIVGLPVLNRAHAAFKQTAGLFVSVYPARFDFGTELSLQSLLQSITRELKQNYRHQRVPVSEINRLALGGEGAGRSAFDVSVSYEKHGYDTRLGNATGQAVPLLNGSPLTPLTLFVREYHEKAPIDLDFVYRTDCFSADDVAALQQRFLAILAHMQHDPATPVWQVPLLTPAEVGLMEGWNDTSRPFALDEPYAVQFSAVARARPDALAVACRGTAWSYRELDERADAIAHALAGTGVGRDNVVAVLGERGPALMAMIVGVLKAGAAYLPLDVNQPAARWREILAVSQAPVLLVTAPLQGEALQALPEPPPRLLVADCWMRKGAASAVRLPEGASTNDLAYVIFTSGSTGQPKGAMVEQRGMLNNIYAKLPSLGLHGGDRIAQTAPSAFDISVWQFLAGPLVGASVHILPDDVVHDPLRLLDALASEGLTLLEIVPSMLRRLLDACGAEVTLPALRWVLPTGEALPPELARAWLLRFPHVPLMNLYGPAECADDVACQPVRTVQDAEAWLGRQAVPIGRPVANTQLHVLDSRLQPMPIGIAGEICIAGAGVGRGYVNDPLRTARAFVPHPRRPGQRLYRSGDLGRYLADGVVEFLGRQDHQVKVRGQRIELGEIEARLRALPGVQEAAVIASPDADGELRLIAYWVPRPDAHATPEAVRDALARCLPHYMVPAACLRLESLPLNANGKIDRQQLPSAPPAEPPAAQLPAEGATEQALAEIWCEVLGLPRVGREDHFFLLGGSSVQATRVLARMQARLGVSLPLRAVFEAPRLRALAERLDGHAAAGSGPLVPPAPAAAGDTGLPSFAQARLWVLQRLAPGGAQYHLPVVLRLQGSLDPGALRQSLHMIADRHDMLRASLPERDGEPVLKIADAADASLATMDLRPLPPARRREQAMCEAQALALRPFDLGHGPLWRASLLQLADDEHWLSLCLHHAIADGASLDILLAELAEGYSAAVASRPPVLAPMELGYAGFAAGQRQHLQGAVLARLEAYWQDALRDMPAALELPLDRPRPRLSRHAGAHVPIALPQDLTAALQGVAQQHGCTLFMTLLASFGVLLHRCSGQRDFCIGIPVSQRQSPAWLHMVGLLVNTLPLRLRIDPGQRFDELLGQVHTTALGVYGHHDMPFERLVEMVQGPRDLARNPVFQVMFSMLDEAPARPAFSGLKVEPLQVEHPTAKFDLALELAQVQGRLEGHLEYDIALFDPESVERMAACFKVLLRAVARQAAQPVAGLALLDEAQRHRVLHAWNRTHQAYELHDGYARHFARQLERTPNAVAALCGEVQWSYSEMDLRAHRVAQHLLACGVRPGMPVAILADRGLPWLAALLGTLQAGGAYMPLDPRQPVARIRQMAGQAAVPVLLVSRRQRALADELVTPLDKPLRMLVIEDLIARGERRVLQGAPATGTDLAYLIFTSGSTGQPKGVMIEHRNMLNNLFGQVSILDLHAGDRIAQTAPVTFDVHVWQALTAWLVGGSVCIVPDEVAHEPSRLLAEVVHQQVSVLQLVPSYLRYVLESAIESPGRAGLRWLLTIGEALPSSLAAAWCRLAPDVPLMNLYGPAECADIVTFHRVSDAASAREPQDRGTVPLGRPKPNVEVYLLDEALQPVPIGVPGEICVGGAGVGRGYLGDDARTRAAFPAHPFGGGRFYRTGDIGRYRPDGVIEFIGRRDHQVKVRGQRLELAEVESTLKRLPAVADAVVVARPDERGDASIVAYVVARDALASPPEFLRTALLRQLPGYMVPGRWVMLERLPLNANGKLDRRALPEPGPLAAGAGPQQPPATPTEAQLARLWSDTLGVPPAGREDDFFDLGGHSLLAARLVAKLRPAFGVEFALRDVFEAPTLRDMAAKVDALAGTAPAVGARDGHALMADVPDGQATPAPLSFEQARLWYLDRLSSGSNAYNMAGAVRLAGRLDEGALQRALDAVLQRHGVLRTCYPLSAGEPVQLVHEDARITVRTLDLTALNPPEREAAARRHLAEECGHVFDLSTDLPLRVLLIRLADEEHVLAWTVHHIASDEWSQQILLRELLEAYASPPAWSPLPMQYTDHARRQRGLPPEVLEPSARYWLQQLAGAPPLLALPWDRPRPARQDARGRSVQCVLPGTLRSRLLQRAQHGRATLFMALAAAFQLLLSRYSGQEDVCIGIPVANRPPGTEDLVGLFVNTAVLRTRIDLDAGFDTLLSQVRATALEAYQHASLPFDRLVERLKPPRSPSHTPLFQAMFTLQQPDAAAARPPGLIVEPMRLETQAAKFDLVLAVHDDGRQLDACFEYACALFEHETIERLSCNFQVLLDALLAAPDRPVGELPLLTTQERGRLLQPALRPHAGIGHIPDTAPACFEAQVEKTPDHVAVSFRGQVLSYRELNAQANRVAHHLRARGAKPESLVVLYVERSIEFIVGVLGILKSGAAYLPIDPSQPRARVEQILSDARPRLVMTQDALREQLPHGEWQVLSFDADRSAIARHSGSNPPPTARAGNMAYVIYTSGSTGKPKGVAVKHGSLRHLVQANVETYGLEPGQRMLQFFSMGFDASMHEIFTALPCGAALHLAPADAIVPGPMLERTLIDEKIDVLTVTPSALALLDPARLPGLRTLIVGGEHCDRAVIAPWLAGRAVFNVYGPTEATVSSAIHRCSPEEPGHPPVGKPLPNTRAYVLDKYLNPVPIGVVGQLYLGGAHLARGYLDPGHTADRFMPDPHADTAGARMYATGDLARCRSDGNIEVLGRVDTQVKVRGYRIELGEIEAAIGLQPAVLDVAVLARGDHATDRQLVAYVVASPGGLDVAALRAALRARLPAYMLPARFVRLSTMPLTRHGKADRQALAALDLPDEERGHEPPRTPTEQALAAIWSRLLERHHIDRNDDFFELGGHSLLAVQLVGQIGREMGVDIPLSQLLQSPTLAGLAAGIDGRQGRAALIVALRQPGPGVPIYFIHPAGGTVFCYAGLARHLPPSQPAYAIQSPDIAGHAGMPEGFTELGALYANEIQAHCPLGPLQLAGWSLGGALAVEVAWHLEQSGRAVDAVALFDATLAGRWDEDLSFEEFLSWANGLGAGIFADDHDGLAARLGRFVEQCGGVPAAARCLQSPDHPPRAGGAFRPGEVDFLRQQHAAHRRHRRLLGGRTARRVQAPLLLAWADESSGQHAVDWLHCTTAREHSREIVLPGQHDTFLAHGDNARAIAALLRHDQPPR